MSTPLDDAHLHEFTAWGRVARDWLPGTAKSYRFRVRTTDKWLAEHRDTTVVDAGEDDLTKGYLEQSTATATRNHYRAALVAWYAWLISAGHRDDNPAEQLPTQRKRRTVPRALSSAQAAAMVAAADAAGREPSALVRVLFYAGLRIGEARRLEWASIEDGFLRITGKGSHERIVPLKDEARSALGAWDTACPSPKYVFPSPIDPYRPSSYERVRLMTDRAAQVADIESWHPHLTRHTFATRLVELGVPIRVVQELLGHASLATTQVYLSVRPTALVEAIGNMPAFR